MISMQLMNTVEVVTLSRESHNFMACITIILPTYGFEVIEWYVGLKPFLSTRDASISGS